MCKRVSIGHQKDNHTEKEHIHKLKIKKTLEMKLNLLIYIVRRQGKSHKPSSNQVVDENYITYYMHTFFQCPYCKKKVS